MNHNEAKIAAELISNLDSEGYLVGDTAYDSNNLYEITSQKSIQLVASQRKKGKALGHRQHSPSRIRSIELLSRPFGQSLMSGRMGIERMFGNFVSFSGGLKPLPHWVRTLPRVELWLRGKILLFQIWRTQKNETKCA